MSASADLYSLATYWQRRADGGQHEPDPARPPHCRRDCWRCYLEAKARIHGRAGDSARELEER